MRRLERLNGGPLRTLPAGPRTPASPEAPGGPETPAFTPPPPRVMTLEDAAAGDVHEVPGLGQAYVITTPLRTLGVRGQQVRDHFRHSLHDPQAGARGRLGRRCRRDAWAPEEIVFIDLETTGLAHAPLFLIGAIFWEDADLVVRQYLARDYAEEAAATGLFLARAAATRLLISFNGKSFDLPYLRTRAIANAVPFTLQAEHFDLLHESRRVWRRRVPNCRLQTLEQCICGRPPRHGDIPGARIPDAYHAFVRTRNAVQLAQIIRHNLLDLVTLVELLGRLPPVEE